MPVSVWISLLDLGSGFFGLIGSLLMAWPFLRGEPLAQKIEIIGDPRYVPPELKGEVAKLVVKIRDHERPRRVWRYRAFLAGYGLVVFAFVCLLAAGVMKIAVA
jgi:hypothetical protein